MFFRRYKAKIRRELKLENEKELFAARRAAHEEVRRYYDETASRAEQVFRAMESQLISENAELHKELMELRERYVAFQRDVTLLKGVR